MMECRISGNTFVRRVLCKSAFMGVMLMCAVWSAGSALAVRGQEMSENVAHGASVEWPQEWDGVPLRPLALSEVEERFAGRFPGAMARMHNGHQVLVLRHVTAPTRMLHPAVDCYRSLGYRIQAQQLEVDARQRMWRCFVAQPASGAALRVCERIEDADGQAFTDTSAWYWAAVAGQSHGPWQAVTTARVM